MDSFKKIPTSGNETFNAMRRRSSLLLRNRLNCTSCNIIKKAVALPPGESCAAWVGANGRDFFNDLEATWDIVAAGSNLDAYGPGEGFPSGVVYRWSDGSNNKVSTVSAPVYIETVLGWIREQMNDETKFSNYDDEDYNYDEENEERIRTYQQTPQFAALCGQIYRRLFRIYGIIYATFWAEIEILDMIQHTNSCFKHFCFFALEFGLLPEREMEPLEVLVRPIRDQYKRSKPADGVDTNELSPITHKRVKSSRFASILNHNDLTVPTLVNANAA